MLGCFFCKLLHFELFVVLSVGCQKTFQSTVLIKLNIFAAEELGRLELVSHLLHSKQNKNIWY